MIREYGRLLDSDQENSDDAIHFQGLIDSYKTSEDAYNLKDMMRRLSPSCSEMLVRCIWRGVELPCMQDHAMFEFRTTQYGHCCTFNYVRPNIIHK